MITENSANQAQIKTFFRSLLKQVDVFCGFKSFLTAFTVLELERNISTSRKAVG